jgi:hypothetical protein
LVLTRTPIAHKLLRFKVVRMCWSLKQVTSPSSARTLRMLRARSFPQPQAAVPTNASSGFLGKRWLVQNQTFPQRDANFTAPFCLKNIHVSADQEGMARVRILFWFIALACSSGFGETTAELRLRAESGDPSAQNALAENYLANFYYADAEKWFKQAAAQGVLNAQWRLGQMLLDGRSGFPKRSGPVPANPRQAIHWLKRAAAMGHAGAQNELGRCYETGKSVPKDGVEAYKWFALAAKYGGVVARTYRDQLALKLSAREIKEAQRRIEAFVPGKEPELWAEIQLKGISGVTNNRFAMVNNVTVKQGEEFVLKLSGGNVRLRCETILTDSVIVSHSNQVKELVLSESPSMLSK